MEPASPVAVYRERQEQEGAALWSVDFIAPVKDWLVLPDGCIDVVLVTGRAPAIAGPATRPQRFSYAPGTRAVGWRLPLGAAPSLLGLDPREVTDGALYADALTHEPLRTSIGRADELLQAGDPDAAGALLAERLGRGGRDRDDVVLAAAARLCHAPWVRIAALATELSISDRQLRRRFAAAVGYGPRRYGRIMRLQNVTALHRTGEDDDLAFLAARAGYVDQAHLARDCRELAGCTPGALLLQRGTVGLEPDVSVSS